MPTCPTTTPGCAWPQRSPAVVIAAVVRNIIISHRPVYALGEWATPYAPELLGLGTADATALNDDRVGRMLDRLFDADRATMITEAALGVIRNFDIDVSQLHNDSTTVTLTGAYLDADGHARGGKATPEGCATATTRTSAPTC